MKKLNKKIAKTVIRKAIGLPSKAELIALGLAACGTAIAVSEIEKNSPEYAEYKVDGAGKITRPVRIVFLTDLHEKRFGDHNERLIEMIDEADPDVILMGGDMINCKKSLDTEVTLELCRELSKKYPIFYGNGNHEQRMDGMEHDAFVRKLERMGITYLENETAQFGELDITGLDIDKSMYAPVKPEMLTVNQIWRRVGRFDENRFNILLAHSPLFTEAYEDSGADLVLCGHFHGGTIRLSENVGLMTPQYQFFSNKVVGKKQIGNSSMIISSGLGTHSFNIRFNNRPQIVVVDIKK